MNASTQQSAVSVAEEHSFVTHDGVRIFFRYWQGTGKRAVVLLHRGHEHSGRLAHVVEELRLPEVSFFAWDARAHGLSEGEQGSKTTMATFVQDLDEFVRYIQSDFGFAAEDLAVVAQSVGAVIAAAWVHDYGPRIRCMVLAAPAFRVMLYVPFARLGLSVWHKIVGDFYVTSYVKGKALTHDPERIASYGTDPLIKLRISARVLLDLYKISERVVADAGTMRVPTFVQLSGSDWVIRNTPPQRFYERLNTSDKEIYTWKGFFHDTLGEKDRYGPIAQARAFLERHFGQPASLVNADLSGVTKVEYDGLARALPWWSPEGLAFAGTRLFLRTVGKLSDGIRLGCETGFDSGQSLDYVYRNKAAGFAPIGILIDWIYLNSPGWIGIRVRRLLIEELIGRTIGRLRRGGRAVRIVDVAAGHGRYVLEALKDCPADDVLLRDFDPSNVESGRRLIAEKGLAVRFEQADAFDRKSFVGLAPTLAIISGLFELFPSNDPIRETLGGLAAAMAPGGFLLYTGQPWHPQIEFIARTLTSHRNGEPWVMRRRTQEELDELVRNAGFRKIEQRIDPEGLFTVSVAERVE